MAGIARHLFHYPSALDGELQPYLVCAPQAPSQDRLPVVILLHDTLAKPTPSEFVEEAFSEAKRWLPALAVTEPLLLLQPFGHGNPGWLGAGGRDLFDVLDELEYKFPIDPRRVSLFGIGAGGTGALQLACWFPDRFSAVAAIGAWADPSLDLAPGQEDWLPWEKAQRQALSPLALVKSLLRKPVHLEHPWWLLGFSGSVSGRHFQALRRELERSKLARFADEKALSLMRDIPSDRAELLCWLAEQQCTHENLHLTTYSLRADICGPARIARIGKRGSPATCEIVGNNGTLRIRTKNVESLELQTASLGADVHKLQIDKQTIEIPSQETVAIERHGKEWECLLPSLTSAPARESGTGGWTRQLIGRRLAGPVMDLRWGACLFVAGTLGGEDDNERMSQYLDDLRRRWISGEDSLQMHAGDRSLLADLPSAVDVEVTDEMLATHHLVLAGNPWNNLLLARFAGSLPCEWERGQSGARMTLLGKDYSEPNDVVFSLSRNPEYPDRYVFVIGINETSALVDAAKMRTAFLPDYLVQRGTKVLQWGYFDWNDLDGY